MKSTRPYLFIYLLISGFLIDIANTEKSYTGAQKVNKHLVNIQHMSEGTFGRNTHEVSNTCPSHAWQLRNDSVILHIYKELE